MTTTAFDGPRIAGMVRTIRTSSRYWPDLELVAVEGDEVVGQVMVSGTRLRSPQGERLVGMLSPLAVLPTREREGIGTALVAAALAAADERGEPLVVLEGSPRFYGSRGFVPAAAAGIDMPIPEWALREAAQVALLSAYDPSDPSLRGHVIYPPEVAALGSA